MGRPRVYATPAARTAAYRARRSAQNTPAEPKSAPGYTKWRRQVREARALLDDVYEELSAWMQDRSERWQESDRAGDLEAEKDELWTIIDTLEGMSVLGRS